MSSIYEKKAQRSSPTGSSRLSTGPSQAQVSGAGRLSFSIADPSGSLQKSVGNLNAGFIGMGKGLVSLVENIPVVGGITKPLIGFAGSIVDNTIGRGVSALEHVKIGNTNLAQATVKGLELAGTPLKFAMDTIAAPGHFIEQKVAEARIQDTLSGTRKISALFGNAPADVMAMVSNGSTIEQAAEHLASTNGGYSDNGLANLGWSLLLDPINLIAPGAGKIAKIGAESSAFIKIAERAALEGASGASKAIEAQKFLSKWRWAGEVYDATMSVMSPITKRFSSTLAKEAVTAMARVSDATTMNGFLDDIVLAGGSEVAQRGLRNFAVTAMNAIKSGAVRTVTAIRRSGSEDLANTIIQHFTFGFANGKSVAELLGTKVYGGGDVSSLLTKIGVNEQDINRIVDVIKSKSGIKRLDELTKDPDIQKQIEFLTRQHADWTVANKTASMKMVAEVRTLADSRLAAEEMTRILFEAKNEVIPLASNAQLGIPELAKYLAGGFGLTPEKALEVATAQFAKHAGDVRKLTDVLSIARGANFGQAARELASIRNLFDKTDVFSRITITSARSLTKGQAESITARVSELKAALEKAVAAGDDALQATIKEELKAQSDYLVRNFDEFAAQFGTSGAHTYGEVFDFLDKARNLTVRELNPSEQARIVAEAATNQAMRQVGELQKQLDTMGYRLGIAPEDGIARATTLVTDHFGKEKLVQMTMPFADTIDHIAIQGVDNAGIALRPTRLARIWDKVSRPFGTEVTKNVVAERFVTSMVGKYGISVNNARRILADVNSLAATKSVQIKALFADSVALEKIFRKGMGNAFGDIADKGSTPFKEILDAAAGDLSSAGLTSGFTGRVKAVFPVITEMTDRFYPAIRFGDLNPYFNLVLERIETSTQMLIYGIKKELANDLTGEIQGTSLRRAFLDPRNINREIADGSLHIAAAANRNTIAAIENSPAFSNRVQRIIKEWFSIKGVKDTKTFARDMMADKFASNSFIDLLDRAAPGVFEELAIHFNVHKAEDVMQLILEEALIQSDPILLAEKIAKDGKLVRGLVTDSLVEKLGQKGAQELADTVVGAYEVAILKGSRLADKAQYFASQRSWLERSLNHPFLAIYPYSYMTQKVIPSMMRLMFLTPTGRGFVMPGLGYAKYRNFLEYANNKMNSDQTFVDTILQQPAFIFLINTLLPATPDNIGVSAPSWLRKGIIQPGLRGTPLNPGNVAPIFSNVISQIGAGTVLGQSKTTLEGVQSVQDATRFNQGISDFIQSNVPTPQDIQDAVLGIRGN